MYFPCLFDHYEYKDTEKYSFDGSLDSGGVHTLLKHRRQQPTSKILVDAYEGDLMDDSIFEMLSPIHWIFSLQISRMPINSGGFGSIFQVEFVDFFEFVSVGDGVYVKPCHDSIGEKQKENYTERNKGTSKRQRGNYQMEREKKTHVVCDDKINMFSLKTPLVPTFQSTSHPLSCKSFRGKHSVSFRNFENYFTPPLYEVSLVDSRNGYCGCDNNTPLSQGGVYNRGIIHNEDMDTKDDDDDLCISPLLYDMYRCVYPKEKVLSWKLVFSKLSSIKTGHAVRVNQIITFYKELQKHRGIRFRDDIRRYKLFNCIPDSCLKNQMSISTMLLLESSIINSNESLSLLPSKGRSRHDFMESRSSSFVDSTYNSSSLDNPHITHSNHRGDDITQSRRDRDHDDENTSPDHLQSMYVERSWNSSRCKGLVCKIFHGTDRVSLRALMKEVKNLLIIRNMNIEGIQMSHIFGILYDPYVSEFRTSSSSFFVCHREPHHKHQYLLSGITSCLRDNCNTFDTKSPLHSSLNSNLHSGIDGHHYCQHSRCFGNHTREVRVMSREASIEKSQSSVKESDPVIAFFSKEMKDKKHCILSKDRLENPSHVLTPPPSPRIISKKKRLTNFFSKEKEDREYASTCRNTPSKNNHLRADSSYSSPPSTNSHNHYPSATSIIRGFVKKKESLLSSIRKNSMNSPIKQKQQQQEKTQLILPDLSSGNNNLILNSEFNQDFPSCCGSDSNSIMSPCVSKDKSEYDQTLDDNDKVMESTVSLPPSSLCSVIDIETHGQSLHPKNQISHEDTGGFGRVNKPHKPKSRIKKSEKSAIIPPSFSHHEENIRALVMEKINGPDMFDYLQNHQEMLRSDKDLFLFFYKEIVTQVYLLHQHGISHMDIKLENMVFSKQENKLYFIDFGLCNIRKSKQQQHYEESSSFLSSYSKHGDQNNQAKIKKDIISSFSFWEEKADECLILDDDDDAEDDDDDDNNDNNISTNSSSDFLGKVVASDFVNSHYFSDVCYNNPNRIYREMALCNNVLHSPPEQYRFSKIIPEAYDVWRVGMSLYCLFTGCFPNFDTDTLKPIISTSIPYYLASVLSQMLDPHFIDRPSISYFASSYVMKMLRLDTYKPLHSMSSRPYEYTTINRLNDVTPRNSIFRKDSVTISTFSSYEPASRQKRCICTSWDYDSIHPIWEYTDQLLVELFSEDSEFSSSL